MVDTPISLDTTEQSQPLSLDPGTTQYLLSPQNVTDRAFKISYALQGTPAQITTEDATNAVAQNKETELREQTASTLNAALMNKRYDLISQTLSNRQEPLTPEDYSAIDTLSGFNFPYKYPINPNSVIETNFAHQYIGELDKFAQQQGDTNFWNIAQSLPRSDLEAARTYGDVTTAQYQYLVTKMQNAQAQADQQSYVGYGLDIAKTFLAPWYEYKQRGNVPGVGELDGGLLGENLERQRNQLNSMPFDQYTDTVDKALARMTPIEQMGWLQGMLGQSTSDKFLNNVNTVSMFGDVPAAFKVGQIVFTKAAMAASVRTALKTALKASANPELTKADMRASVGDLKGSALENTSNLLTGRITGSLSPVEDAINTLPVNMNIFRNDIIEAGNAGVLSNTYQNILLEQTEGSTSRALRILANTIRPTQINLENATADVLDRVSQTVARRYPGENNAMIKVSMPTFNHTTKLYDVTLWIGRDGGLFFHDYDAAADAAIAKGFRVTYDADHIDQLKARISDLQEQIKAGPSLEDDTHGLNYFNSLPDTLKTLEDKLQNVSRPNGARIGQQGTSYYIEHTAPVRYSDIRDLYLDPNNPMDVSPDSWTKNIPYLNHIRTSEDTFSPAHRANRKAAVYPQATFRAMVNEEGKIIDQLRTGANRYDPVTGELNPFYKRGIPIVRRVLNKQRITRFNDLLDKSQNEFIDPITKKEGYYLTPKELYDYYIRRYGEAPSFDEVSAYEAVKRWDELQRMFTQVSQYSVQAQTGNETHVLITRSKSGAEIRSPEITGALEPGFPSSSGSMLTMGNDLDSGKVVNLGRLSVKTKEEMLENVKLGTHKIVRIWDPEQMPLRGMGFKGDDKLIHFMYAPNIETSALKWDSVPRTGGGRFIYDYSHYIKQPKMKYENGLSYYLGDQTVAPVAYRSMGEDVAKKMSVVRRLINNAQEEEAKAAYINNGLEGALEPWGDFRKKFERWKDDEGNWHEPVFNSEEDFRVVPRNVSVSQLDDSLMKKYGAQGSRKFRNTWHDATRENSPARNFQVKFTGERDAQGLQSIDNIGTYQNPIYRKSPAKKISPVTMLNRGMNSVINSMFMDSYKNYAVNSWLQEAEQYLIPAERRTMWSAPFGTFKTITRQSFLPGTPQSEVNKLMANHFKIDQLTNVPSVMDTFAHSLSQSIADAAYRNLGPTAASLITPTWMLNKLRDPFAFIRSVTFNAYLGLFSVPQLLVQSMNYVNMFAISPRYATAGTMATYMYYLSRFNKSPEIMAKLDEMVSKFHIPGIPQYKPGEWLEAVKTFEDSGFKHVGAEHALTDSMSRVNIIQGTGSKWLEWGRKPFQWGEANSRTGAWFLAMKEFRDLHPTGKLSDSDISQILDRADFFQGNMSTASASAINSGVFSLPTQFYLYATRLAEMFWSGTRLGGTRTERNLARARLVAVNAAAFGLPMAAGVTGLPVTDYIRQSLMDNGYFGYTPPYVVGKNFTESLVNEGLPAALLASATGNWYNIGPREGLQGLNNLVQEDPSYWKILGGASATLSFNTVNNGLYPIIYDAYNNGFRNLKLENFIDVFKEAQIVNSGWSTWVAMNTGKWINKNSDTIAETSKQNAAFMFLTGLREDTQSDLWPKESTVRNRQDLQKYATKQATLWINRSLLAQAENDPDTAKAFMDKALAWLPATDYPPDKAAHIIANVVRNNSQTLPDRVNFEFYIKKAPPSQQETLRKAFEYTVQHK